MGTKQLVVRIPSELEDDLQRAAARTRKSRSVVVREALQLYLRPDAGKGTAADRVAHLVGSVESGIPDLAENDRRYKLLAELGTQPRTTYLAKVRNPNPEMHG